MYPRDTSLSPREVFLGNLVWVGGGMSIGTRRAFRTFSREYEAAAEAFLAEGLGGTDQQVIYAMFSPHRRQSPATRIQPFRWPGGPWGRPCWFYLGYLCYRQLP